MQYLKAEIFFLLVFVTDYIRTELDPDGKNVCLTTENYKETVMVQVQKKKTEKNWCWKIRCSKTKLYYVDEPRVFKRTRIVAKCCDGYREEEGRNDCAPACLKGCKNGKCVAPDTCACDPGFHGSECDKACSEGWWGVNCVNKCNCSDNGKCNKEKGCECKPGWMGDRCDLPCQEGYYGYSCEKKCNCDLACNHETGECTIKALTTVPTAATSYEVRTPTNYYLTIEKGQVSVSEGTERNQVSVSEKTERSEDSESEETERNQVSVSEGTERNQVSVSEKTEGSEGSESEETERNQVSVSEGTERNQISVSEVPGSLKTKIFTEVVDTTESRWGEDIEIEDEVNSEIPESNETELPNSVTPMIQVTKSTEDAIHSDTTPKLITEPLAIYNYTSKRTEETTEKEEDIKFRMQNEIEFLETFVRNASIKGTEGAEYTTEINRDNTLDTTITNNETFWITFTDSQEPKGEETDNLINSEKGSTSKDYLNTEFHFFGSLSILTGISFVIFVIAAKWIILSHKRRVQKIVIAQKEKTLHTEQGKDQTQNFFWVNGCAENPVYLSDVDINKAVPILQSFKPVN